MDKKEVAKILLNIKAVTLNVKEGYKWVSGIYAPIYCDNRLLISYPEQRSRIADAFIKVIEQNNIDFDIIAGVATGAIAHAAWVADKLQKPMIYIRGETKGHGKQNRIEGVMKKGQKVLVIEDLVSTGGSSVSAVNAVKDEGGIVEYCIAIFTYELEKAKKNFENSDCRLITLSNFSTLIDAAAEMDYIDKVQKAKVLEWSKNPEAWGKMMGFE